MKKETVDSIESIRSVRQATMAHIKARLNKWYWWVLLVLLFIFALPFNLFFIIIVVAVIYYAQVWNKMQNAFMQQVAEKLGYKVDSDPFIPVGTLFNIGYARMVKNTIEGDYQGTPVKIFNYNFTIGSGKNRHTFPFTVFELDVKTPVSSLVLAKNDWFFLNALREMIHGKEELKLEGDFNKYFRLYIEKGQQIEALQIFTPDIMIELIDRFQKIDINVEIAGDKIYIFFEKIISKKDEFLLAYQLVSKFSEKFVDSVEDVGEHYNGTSTK